MRRPGDWGDPYVIDSTPNPNSGKLAVISARDVRHSQREIAIAVGLTCTLRKWQGKGVRDLIVNYNLVSIHCLRLGSG